MHGKFGQQAVRSILPARELDRLRQGERRTQDPERDELAHDVDHSDRESHRSSRRAVLDRVEKLPPERKDLVGVAVGDPSRVGQLEAPPGTNEEPLAERLLQRAQLRAQRRLRQPQLRARPGDAPLFRDRPEVEQVVIIQPFHGSIDDCNGTLQNILFVACPAGRYSGDPVE